VQTVAATYNSDVYTEAANNFRIPYWDWAAIPALPPVVSDDTVQIETPTGTQTVANPLYLYKFQQFPLNSTWFPNGTDVGEADQDLSQDPITLRFPDQPVQGTSQPDIVNEDLGAEGLMNMVVSILLLTPYLQEAHISISILYSARALNITTWQHKYRQGHLSKILTAPCM
jgi:tyrosinase